MQSKVFMKKHPAAADYDVSEGVASLWLVYGAICQANKNIQVMHMPQEFLVLFYNAVNTLVIPFGKRSKKLHPVAESLDRDTQAVLGSDIFLNNSLGQEFLHGFFPDSHCCQDTGDNRPEKSFSCRVENTRIAAYVINFA
jgi:hypothetical protein